MNKIIVLFFFFFAFQINVFSQNIPDGITYLKKDDDLNEKAIAKLEQLLFIQDNDNISNSIGCGPYFWQELVNAEIFSSSIGIPMVFIIPNGDSISKLEGRVIRWKDQTQILLELLRKIISSSDGFKLRKLTLQEMQIYWMMIPYDIEEPIFTLEGPGIQLLIDCSDNGDIFFIDNYYRLTHLHN